MGIDEVLLTLIFGFLMFVLTSTDGNLGEDMSLVVDADIGIALGTDGDDLADGDGIVLLDEGGDFLDGIVLILVLLVLLVLLLLLFDFDAGDAGFFSLGFLTFSSIIGVTHNIGSLEPWLRLALDNDCLLR